MAFFAAALPFMKAAAPWVTAGAGLLSANASGNRAAAMGRSSMLYGQQALHDKTRLAQDQTAWGIGQFLQSEQLGRANKKFDYNLTKQQMRDAPDFAKLLGQAGTEIQRRNRNYFFEPDSKRQRLANIGENNFGTLWGGTAADMFGPTGRQLAKEAMAREYRRAA